MRSLHPKFVFIQFGDTDLHAHNGRYDYYLSAIHNIDDYVRLIWEQVQSDPFYRDNTTIIITCDHGRGFGDEWGSHGSKVKGSEATWLMLWGKGIEPQGEMLNNGPFYTKQIAATIASILGIDFTPDDGIRQPAISM